MTTALYRRYRPQSFADVIGQEHVTDPLMQALRTSRVNHAYLFSGPRGCGKTTSARILARCLNCAEGPTPEPCGTCDSCVALATGGPGSVDVIEIDAASHGGVEDARDLREKAAYGPAQSRYKVYIIDEAHMVTPQGFNALLKIVEEPPEHVKFIFATTEPDKVIGTIRSRTHHYPFRLVPPQRLTEYLDLLCTREGVAVEPGVLSFVVRAGGGSVRDSLSVLDQLIAGSGAEGLTYAGAAALLGFTEGELLDATVEALAAGDGGSVFRQVHKVIETGHDPRRFIEDLLERFRDLIVIAAMPEGAGAVLRGMPADQVERMRHQAASFGPGELSRCADLVNAGLTELSGATSPRLQLELICARLLLPAASGEHGYAARLDRLERRLTLGESGGTPVPPGRAAPDESPAVRHPATAPAASPDGQGAPVGSARERAFAQARAASGSPPAARDRQGTAEQDARGPVSPGQAPGGSASGGSASGGSAAGGSAADRAPANHEGVGERGSEAGPGLRVRSHEAGVDEGVAPAHGGPTPPGGTQGPRPATPRGGLDTDALRRSWPDVLAKIFTIRRVTWTFLSEHAQVLEYDGTRLVLGIATEGLARTFHNGPNAEVVRQALIETLGVDVRVDGVPMGSRPLAATSPQQAPPAQLAPQPPAAQQPQTAPAPQSHAAPTAQVAPQPPAAQQPQSAPAPQSHAVPPAQPASQPPPARQPETAPSPQSHAAPPAQAASQPPPARQPQPASRAAEASAPESSASSVRRSPAPDQARPRQFDPEPPPEDDWEPEWDAPLSLTRPNVPSGGPHGTSGGPQSASEAPGAPSAAIPGEGTPSGPASSARVAANAQVATPQAPTPQSRSQQAPTPQSHNDQAQNRQAQHQQTQNAQVPATQTQQVDVEDEDDQIEPPLGIPDHVPAPDEPSAPQPEELLGEQFPDVAPEPSPAPSGPTLAERLYGPDDAQGGAEDSGAGGEDGPDEREDEEPWGEPLVGLDLPTPQAAAPSREEAAPSREEKDSAGLSAFQQARQALQSATRASAQPPAPSVPAERSTSGEAKDKPARGRAQGARGRPARDGRSRGGAEVAGPATSAPARSADDPIDGDASPDDEVISDIRAVGQPVIADILGGVVIAELEE